MGALGVVLPLLPAQGGWRNGRRARFRSVCPKGREGSNPSSPTRLFMLFAGRWPASRWSAVLARGDDPPEPPARRTIRFWVLAAGLVLGCCGAGRWPASRWSAVLARGDDPPEPPAPRTIRFWVLAAGLVLGCCGAGRWPASRWSAVLARGDDPPEPPAPRTIRFWVLAAGLVLGCCGAGPGCAVRCGVRGWLAHPWVGAEFQIPGKCVGRGGRGPRCAGRRIGGAHFWWWGVHLRLLSLCRPAGQLWCGSQEKFRTFLRVRWILPVLLLREHGECAGTVHDPG